MAAVTFLDGPLAGDVRDVDAHSVNVIIQESFGRVSLITYRCDLDQGSAVVVSEEALV